PRIAYRSALAVGAVPFPGAGRTARPRAGARGLPCILGQCACRHVHATRTYPGDAAQQVDVGPPAAAAAPAPPESRESSTGARSLPLAGWAAGARSRAKGLRGPGRSRGDALGGPPTTQAAPSISPASPACLTTIAVAVMSAVVLATVAKTSGIVSTASSTPSGSTGRPIAWVTGMLVVMKLTCPGRPTEPMLTTMLSPTAIESWAALRSTPYSQAMKLATTMYCGGLAMRNSDTAIGSTSEVTASG